MNAKQMPGAGDYEAFPVVSPIDPRVFDDADDSDDASLDVLAEIRDWADMAEVAHKNGNDDAAMDCIANIRRICDEVLG